MTFPNNHYYLTLHWQNTSEPLEGGQVGIRFDSAVSSVAQTVVDAAKAPVQTFWSAAGSQIPNTYQLVLLRLAAIGQDGKYVPGSIARDGVYATPINGGGSTTGTMPLQVALASTLTTGVPRGQAALGRVFLPPLSVPLNTSSRWTVAQVDARSANLATMLSSLNTAMQSSATVFSKGTVKSSVGAKQKITGVKTGTRPDVQRRRAKQVVEIYGGLSPLTN